jgi:serine protease
MKGRILFLVLGVMVLVVALGGRVASGSVQADEPAPDRLFGQFEAQPTNQIMVKFRAGMDDQALSAAAGEATMAALSQAAGEELTYVRPMSGGAHVLAVNKARQPAAMAQISARLDALPEVEYAEPDLIKTIDRDSFVPAAAADLAPNDTLYGDQWHYLYAPGSSEGLNLPPAWAMTTGSSDTVVAVIDTGILSDHPDLASKIVPGYDMITDVSKANDGDGRDADPSDPGDWVAQNECPGGNSASDSSWHGSHVAGTIAAASNNAVGVAGVNWAAKILPVRVLGKCGGTTSDIIDAVRWAAGLTVPGAPANANPADVINLSLGGFGSCSAGEQSAFNAVVAAGATVVIAAGNSNANAAFFSPGNCDNVITVAANNRAGDRAWYSNYGGVVEISAPGGETSPQASSGVLSTLNDGATSPGSHSYAYYQGTSMAAPHVAGLASLIKSEAPAYSQAQVLHVIQTTARSFPAGSNCNTSVCGAGIADAFETLFYLGLLEQGQQTHLPYLTLQVEEQPGAVPNGDFEQGSANWTEFSFQGWPLIMTPDDGLPIAPHNGQYAVWLGGDNDEIAYIEQSLHVSSVTPHLTYWHWINSSDLCGYDFGGTIVNGLVVDVYELCTTEETFNWVRHSVDLSAYAGQTVSVQIRVETDEAFESSLYLDDVSFAASAVTTAVEQAGPARTPPAATRR